MGVLVWTLGYFLYFSATIYVFNLLIANFLSCPYIDFLSWDGNLRAITSLKILSSLKLLDIVESFRLILDTPTWPILRNLVQVILYSLTGENGTVDTLLTTCSLVLFLGFLPFIYLNTLRDFQNHKARWNLDIKLIGDNQYTNLGIEILYSLFFSFLLVVSLILSNNYILYAFSPMLEIQGSIFTITFIFFFHKYIIKKVTIRIPILFAFLSLQTKYPYGFLLILFLISFQFIFLLKDLKFSIFLFLSWIRKRNIILTSIAFIFFLFFLSYFQNSGKLSFYLRYFSMIGFFVIILIFFWINPNIPEKIREIELFIILPMIFFIISHPDRVSSSSGTISHSQIDGVIVGDTFLRDWNYYSIFFKTLIIDLPENRYFSTVLILLFIIGLFPLLQKIILKNPRYLLIKYPYILYSLFIVVSLMGLTLLTPNHQSRHVYHLYPSYIFCCSLIFLKIFYLLFTVKKNKITKTNRRIPNQSIKINPLMVKNFYVQNLYFLVLFTLLSLPQLYKFYNKLNENFSNTYLCFGGILDIYATPIEFQGELPELLTQNSILLNGIEENNLNRADVELVFSREAFKKNIKFGIGERDFYRRKNIFQNVILVSRECTEDKYKFLKDKTVIDFLKEEKEINKRNVCVSLYSIVP